MTTYVILENDEAEYHYKRGQILHGFPLGNFNDPMDKEHQNPFDEVLVNKGVNVWRSHREELHFAAKKKFPDISDDGMAVKAFFEAEHIHPSFIYDKAEDRAWLIYQVYGSNKFVGIETSAVVLKRMLETKVRLVESQRQLILQKNAKMPDGIPAKLIHGASEHLKQTQYIFETETGLKLENVPDIYQNEQASIDVRDKFNVSAEMMYVDQYGALNSAPTLELK